MQNLAILSEIMKSQEFLDKLSTHLRNAIASSISVATSLHHKEVTLLHLLYGLISEEGSIAADILIKFSLEKQTIFTTLSLLSAGKPSHVQPPSSLYTTTIPELDSLSKQALEKGILVAYERGHTYVGTEHLLYGIATLQKSTLIFEKFQVEIDDLIEQLDAYFQNTERFPHIDEVADMMNQIQDIHDDSIPMSKEEPAELRQSKHTKKKFSAKKKGASTALEAFCVDITEKALQGTIDPVIGREQEVTRLMHILCRRTKNNPVLVGEPGVGKTAIVEGLAKKIATKDVPDVLKRKRILSLDLPLMIAGTIYRGEFESRLKQIIQEIEHSPDTIIFIDELHTIIGAGANQGTMDAANILKPALARGALRCIGATTLDEYTKYIASDPALERRFQSITVEEPSSTDAIAILTGIAPFYESFHQVRIAKDAIEAAVALSVRYIHDMYLPDKAIDLLDEAAAAKKLMRKQRPEEKKLHAAQDALRLCQSQKDTAIREERFDDATMYKKKEATIRKRITLLEKHIGTKHAPPKEVVTSNDIARVLSERIHIDPHAITQRAFDYLETLPEKLQAELVGQEDVITRVVHALRHSYLRPESKNRPLASFLFTGPSGVGKTTMARLLAHSLFHSEKAFLRLDMSEFSEAHGTAKLLGSPAGYIGHNERNLFLDTIKKRPHSVILFDEIDKAHSDVQKLLLQILDEGVLTDSKGKKIYFHHAVIVLTTNIGSEFFRNRSFGFGNIEHKTEAVPKERREAILQKIKQELGVAMSSRIQEICVFSPLTKEHILDIIRKHSIRLSKHLKESHQLSIRISPKALVSLATEFHNIDTGARHIETAVDTVIHERVIPILKQKKRKKTYILKRDNETYTLV